MVESDEGGEWWRVRGEGVVESKEGGTGGE